MRLYRNRQRFWIPAFAGMTGVWLRPHHFVIPANAGIHGRGRQTAANTNGNYRNHGSRRSPG
ncbi:hypothetical protein DC429_09050 [Arthrobacter sp. TPD3018]|nr:hypothetical protein DC425_08960 [Sphingomonas sp. TPD3009]PVE58449.1 hypothetical protein DC429_09050 [Arthrobacter sp. TPD3018]PVE87794.1 hypothetical protein DC431_04135 [Sphingomonas melonis]